MGLEEDAIAQGLQKEILALRQQKLKGPERKRLRELEDAFRERMKRLTEDIATQEIQEKREGIFRAEQQKISAAVSEAVESGLMMEDIVGDSRGSIDAYLFPWQHPQGVGFDTNLATQEFQHALFCIAHLLEKHGSLSSIHVEGGPYGPRPKRPPFGTIPGTDLSAFCVEGQEFLHRDKRAFLAFISQNSRQFPISFEFYTTHPTTGVHSPSMVKKADWVQHSRNPIDHSKNFQRKYGFSMEAQPVPLVRDGRAKVWFGNGPHFDAEQVLEDAEAVITVLKEFDEFNGERDRELVQLFSTLPSSEKPVVPIGCYGAAHTKDIEQLCAKSGIRLHLVYPSFFQEKLHSLRSVRNFADPEGLYKWVFVIRDVAVKALHDARHKGGE
ncbi:MAG: hypothetical protein Q7R81_01425 [Candidatus Peregrinibacteria bacterium]|nr:hypothetical protein [Candidatus Peregrinibacteria bacterium]